MLEQNESLKQLEQNIKIKDTEIIDTNEANSGLKSKIEELEAQIQEIEISGPKIQEPEFYDTLDGNSNAISDEDKKIFEEIKEMRKTNINKAFDKLLRILHTKAIDYSIQGKNIFKLEDKILEQKDEIAEWQDDEKDNVEITL